MTTDKNAELKAKFLEYFAQLPIQKLGAEYIGVNQDTITDWKRADKKFSDQVDKAKSEWAIRTSKQVRSKEWLLERVMKDHFAERKEVAGPDGNKLQIEFVNPDKKTYGEGTAGDK